LTITFAREPTPASPSQSVRAPTASNTGSATGRDRSGPEARIVRLPCSAGVRVPTTGASTNVTSYSSASASQRSVAGVPIVLIWIHVSGPSVARSAAAATSSTASPSDSIVTITGQPAAASAGSSNTAIPSCRNGCARCTVRL